MPQPTDKNGRDVRVGSRVRVIGLSSHFLKSLPPDELEEVSSMVGEVFDVYEIDEYGGVWVLKEWCLPDADVCMSHSISLAPNEMELVV